MGIRGEEQPLRLLLHNLSTPYWGRRHSTSASQTPYTEREGGTLLGQYESTNISGSKQYLLSPLIPGSPWRDTTFYWRSAVYQYGVYRTAARCLQGTCQTWERETTETVGGVNTGTRRGSCVPVEMQNVLPPLFPYCACQYQQRSVIRDWFYLINLLTVHTRHFHFSLGSKAC